MIFKGHILKIKVHFGNESTFWEWKHVLEMKAQFQNESTLKVPHILVIQIHIQAVGRAYVPCKYIVPWEKVELLLGISFSAEDHKYFSLFLPFPPSLWDFFSHMQKHHHIYRNYSIIYVIRISMSIYHMGKKMHSNTHNQYFFPTLCALLIYNK